MTSFKFTNWNTARLLITRLVGVLKPSSLGYDHHSGGGGTMSHLPCLGWAKPATVLTGMILEWGSRFALFFALLVFCRLLPLFCLQGTPKHSGMSGWERVCYWKKLTLQRIPDSKKRHANRENTEKEKSLETQSVYWQTRMCVITSVRTPQPLSFHSHGLCQYVFFYYQFNDVLLSLCFTFYHLSSAHSCSSLGAAAAPCHTRQIHRVNNINSCQTPSGGGMQQSIFSHPRVILSWVQPATQSHYYHLLQQQLPMRTACNQCVSIVAVVYMCKFTRHKLIEPMKGT